MDRDLSDKVAFLEPDGRSSFDEAQAVILPVPYEGTVSYGKGTSRGPEAILRASEQLELYDEQLADEPFRWGVWTDDPLDVEKTGKSVDEIVARRVGELVDAGKWVAMLGGEHSITPGAVRAVAQRHPGLHVVQLDAHADLRECYEGRDDSHACAMARCVERVPVTALGIRSYSKAEADRIREGISGYRILHAWEMSADRCHELIDALGGQPVYLTVDVDYFDPSVIPATGTPEPGGAGWWLTLELLERLFRTARVVACDVVELAPTPSQHHADFTVARLVHRLIGLARRAAEPGVSGISKAEIDPT